jgi:hypothetical protein
MKHVGQFAVISHHNRLLQSYTNGEMHASQETHRIGQEERWDVFLVSPGVVAFKNVRNGKYLCDRT